MHDNQHTITMITNGHNNYNDCNDYKGSVCGLTVLSRTGRRCWSPFSGAWPSTMRRDRTVSFLGEKGQERCCSIIYVRLYLEIDCFGGTAFHCSIDSYTITCKVEL